MLAALGAVMDRFCNVGPDISIIENKKKVSESLRLGSPPDLIPACLDPRISWVTLPLWGGLPVHCVVCHDMTRRSNPRTWY